MIGRVEIGRDVVDIPGQVAGDQSGRPISDQLVGDGRTAGARAIDRFAMTLSAVFPDS